MTFNYPGYDIIFILKKPCTDNSDHLFTLVYKFFSPVTKYFYILNADYHSEDAFAIKFYCKKDSKSVYKYSKIVNKGDLHNILVTCAKIIPLLLLEYPNASFAFGASSSVDSKNNLQEPHVENQRFAVYKYLVSCKFGPITFEHMAYPKISCYMLINRNCNNVEMKEKELVKMFKRTYPDLISI